MHARTDEAQLALIKRGQRAILGTVVRVIKCRTLQRLGSMSAIWAACLSTPSFAVESAPPAWVTAKPSPATQTQKSAKERGINPCMTPDPGFGVYGSWHRDVSMGQYLQPQRGGIRRDGGFDVMFHFHGHEALRKEWVMEMNGAVLASVDLGIGSGPYESTFALP
ncbi:MAG TPA: hypothetical protein VIV60_11480 [Polyangiaceae bacterium]